MQWRAWRKWREWLLALTLVLGAHLLLLGGLGGLGGQDPGGGARAPTEAARAAVLVVRTLEPSAVQAEPAPQPQPLPLPSQQAAQPPQAQAPALSQQPLRSGQAPGVGPVGPVGPVGAVGPVEAVARGATPAPDPAEGLAEAGVDLGDPSPDGAGAARVEVYGGAPPPVWATRPPGDFEAHYLLQRGDEPARAATLRFEVGDGRYTLQLQPAAGGRGPEQASQGRLEAPGLAPERYLDRRRARAAAAANFDRARSRITYSGASLEQPLFAGTQDRLSWIVQLAAIVEADPARWQERSRLPLYVSGVRGEAQLWVFTVRGRATLQGPGGAAQGLLHLVREPERPYDLRVEAWLDPARQHLPARLQLTPVPAGRPLNWTRIP